MASIGYLKQLINGVPDEQTRKVLGVAFEYLLNNLRLGLVEDQARSENLQLYRYDGRTHATANTEFSIVHGLGEAPTGLMPYVSLTSSGSQMVRLRVTRPADAMRVYLSSDSTNAAISVAVEI